MELTVGCSKVASSPAGAVHPTAAHCLGAHRNWRTVSVCVLIAVSLVTLAALGAGALIAITALRRARPSAVPDVLRELTPLLGVLLRHRRR